MMASSLSAAEAKKILDSDICASAMRFIQLYNGTADSPSKRSAIVHIYAADEPLLLWNGNAFRGLEEISRFWNTFPETRHDVASLDAHPFSVQGSEKSMVVQVMGTISIGGVSRAYSQVLILSFVDGNYRIKSDTHRLIE